MTHKIAQLFGEAGDKIAEEIQNLEVSAGNPSHDVNLLSRSAHQSRKRIAELGLDPDDTTAEELYHSLRARYKNDSQLIEDSLGLIQSDETAKQHAAMEVVGHSLAAEKLWTLKNASIKRLLGQLSPIKTKKSLKYRSVDSMLKRTDVSIILAVARIVESDSWQSKWNKLVQSQPAGEHETSRFRFVVTELPNGLPEIIVPETATVVVSANDGEGFVGHVFRAYEGAQRLAGKDFSPQLIHIHPAMRWWMANLHLTAWLDGQPVSFNVFDIARDYHGDIEFSERSYARVGQKIKQQLYESYDNFVTEIAEEGRQLSPSPVAVAAEVEDV